MTAAEHLRESLDDLGTATGWVDEAIRDVESTTLDEATACLAQLREHVARLRQFDAALERWIADIFRDQHWRDPQETAAGLVEVKRSTTRRMWDHDQAGKAWLSATLDASGGEVPDPFDLLRDFRSAATVAGWKVGAFKALGLDVNDYCSTEPGVPHVYITRREP
jgi:hypothetical protein